MAMSLPALFFERNVKLLQDIFPKADPDFLKDSIKGIFNESDLNDLIAQLLENHNYPTKTDATRRKLQNSNIKKYLMKIDIEKFCEEIPNATEYFQKNKVVVPKALLRYIEHRFANFFLHHRITFINKTLLYNNDSILNAYLKLSMYRPTLKSSRPTKTVQLPELPDISKYKLCFQILAYLEYKDEIDQKIQMQQNILEQKQGGDTEQERLVECQCCFENDFPASTIVNCMKGHEFCKNCVKKSSEILMMEQQFKFPCLTQCDSFFYDETINSVFNKNELQAWNKKRNLAEIQKAGLDGLEACIHCSFHQLMSPEDKVFECLNPECLRATCRKCLKNEHIPFSCEENASVEKHFVENQMSEAVISTCGKCGLKFMKIEGCNSIKCSCGALMCYICKKPIKDYTHFANEGTGGTCPLYVDTENLHNEQVEAAKASATEQLKNRVL